MERLLVLWIEPLSIEAPDGSTLRVTQALLDALNLLCPFSEAVRLGLFALPMRAPSRFYGGDDVVLDAVRRCVRDVAQTSVKLGVGEGLFSAELAARHELVLPTGASAAFRRAQPLEVLARRDLTTTCQRLGLRTVGAFADLDAARVAERFDLDALTRQRVARGELPELEGQRDARLARRLAQLRGEDGDFDEQLGFFGQRGAGDLRADAAALRVRQRLGDEAVAVATLRGGRTPDERGALMPWGAPVSAHLEAAPWPGQLGAPSPATTLTHPVEVQLRDARGAPIVLGVRGLLSAPPATLAFSNTLRREITWFAGPWPLVERWWSLHRRRALVQLVLTSGEAFLLSCEERRWWLVGIYD
ncbi:MAG TPA: hypothetical protein VMU98_07960 [Acidimicrobiales bacterium]|nr:hypothetical protein [Acidimicrobiales bacterium]